MRVMGSIASSDQSPSLSSDQAQREEYVVQTGAELLCSLLLDVGVEVIFGYPGGAVLPIYDALYDASLRHILARHEQGAIHAAEGYARVTGRPGVVLTTSGPGATNAVTGIADAFMDSTPLVVLTGQVATSLIGSDSFQEADIVGITLPITKHNYQVRDIRDLPQIIADAFYIASTGRPGPVLIDLPKDITSGKAQYAPLPKPNPRGYKLPPEPTDTQAQAIIEVIRQARKPLLYVGGGIISAGAAEMLRSFAHQANVPVVSTLMGLGAYAAEDPLFVGMLGMHGTYAANRAVTECDVLIALGVRFDDRVTGKLERFSPHSFKIHVDLDRAEIGKNIAVQMPVVADVRFVLEKMLQYDCKPDTISWLDQVKTWEKEWPVQVTPSNGELRPQEVIQLLAEATQGQAIVTTEVGQHQMWTALFYPFSHPRQFLTSGGLGTMGYGFPAALGAQVAAPEQTVICIAGDASFQMNIQELQTVIENKLPIKVAVINNNFLGMVRQWQQFFYDRRYAESRISSPDFAKVAEAYGALGLTASTMHEAKEVIARALAYEGPVIMNFMVKEEENVFPMVPPGNGTDEMTLEWGDQ